MPFSPSLPLQLRLTEGANQTPFEMTLTAPREVTRGTPKQIRSSGLVVRVEASGNPGGKFGIGASIEPY